MAKSGGRRRIGTTSNNASPKQVPQKRSSSRDSTNEEPKKASKKAKTERDAHHKEEKLSNIIVDFNLALNELFQLREYSSIVTWDPNDFSQYSTSKPQLPENFKYFLQQHDHQLQWTRDKQENLDSLPLRLQKKVLAQRDEQLLQKWPFKTDVTERSKEIEKNLLEDLLSQPVNDLPEAIESAKPKSKSVPKGKSQTKPDPISDSELLSTGDSDPETTNDLDHINNGSKSSKSSGKSRNGTSNNTHVINQKRRSKRSQNDDDHITYHDSSSNEQDQDDEADTKGEQKENEKNEVDEEDENDPGTDYKVVFKYTIPPLKITNPSHIPSWRPEQAHETSINDQTLQAHDHSTTIDKGDEKHTIIDFHPQPLQVISHTPHSTSVPEVESRLRNFLNNSFQSAIIDEANTADYNNTPAEYERILDQQKHLLKRLYEKVTVEQRFELNGDKIERRKTVLPNTANAKLTQDPYRETGTVFPRIQGAANNLTHHDHFLTQGMAFSAIHQQIRKQHQLRTRRIAQMIEQHFKKKKGEKDRLAREREQNLKKISRMAIQAVRKRWSQAQKVYRNLQLQKEEEIKKIKGREHLSQMLEHSTQLLEAQLNKSRDASSGINSPQPIYESNDSDGKNSNSSEGMSSDSESSGNEETLNEMSGKEDIDLSIEQLKKKYANLESSADPSSHPVTEEEIDEPRLNGSLHEKNSGSDSVEESDLDDDDDDLIDESKGLAALYGDETTESGLSQQQMDYSEEQKQLIEQYSREEKDSVLDSDSDDASSSESHFEDDGASDADAESDVDTSESNAAKPSGLAALFENGHAESEKNDHEGDEGDDDDLASEDIDSVSDSDENMTTTDEEDEPTTPKSVHSPPSDQKDQESEIAEEEINGTRVRDVPLPSLLRGTLRPYQKQGLNWLASLYNNNTNGILADEMGLGKTIQTISLLAYLACEHHIWGPHLIVVPTSVMLNWEMEFKKFAPGFKVLTYYGSPQQRAQKRKGWNKPDAFHVCITSYQLVVHDHQSFKRRRWRYMILDEAHNIKNFRSTRWRALLNFSTENRLLLTGTPLQNNLMELWSLLYFLMPSSKVNQAMPDGFANLEDFQQWFGRPVDKILEQTTSGAGDVIDELNATRKMDIETRNTVSRLHQVLRPYLLRRLKKDVEKQMPGKYEHIVYCRLSKRQRYLYDDFMSRAKTKETLASGNFLSIINCLMQLRKVCNHPDLFEVRPIVTSFAMQNSVTTSYRNNELLVRNLINQDELNSKVSLEVLNLDVAHKDNLNYFVAQSSSKLKASRGLENQIQVLDDLLSPISTLKEPDTENYLEYYKFTKIQDQNDVRNKLVHILYLNTLRCDKSPIYGERLLSMVSEAFLRKRRFDCLPKGLVNSLAERIELTSEVVDKYSIITPAVVALDMKDQLIPVSTQRKLMNEVASDRIENPFHKAQVKLSIAFPDKSLLQFDCGKLQKLATLLQDLTANGHRALIFTQMTKVLDILEQFLNIHGYRYMRLDGSTKIEDRQLLTEKFNRDNKIPVFILSTRSGGLGINLTGADTVIFYDSDWNPAMDKQCQDRCHRIGQSRDVHIYRFVSEYTIESNILKKANQKRQLDNVVIQEGEFTTDYFGKFSVKDLVNDAEIVGDLPDKPIAENPNMDTLAQAEDEEDRAAASSAMKEVQVDDEDFDEDSKPGTSGGTPAQTPGPDLNDGLTIEANQPIKEDMEDADYEEGMGHIDEYMLRFIADGYYYD